MPNTRSLGRWFIGKHCSDNLESSDSQMHLCWLGSFLKLNPKNDAVYTLDSLIHISQPTSPLILYPATSSLYMTTHLDLPHGLTAPPLLHLPHWPPSPNMQHSTTVPCEPWLHNVLSIKQSTVHTRIPAVLLPWQSLRRLHDVSASSMFHYVKLTSGSWVILWTFPLWEKEGLSSHLYLDSKGPAP